MGRANLKFVCQECHHEVIKWVGKCPLCHSWNSFEEQAHIESRKTKSVQQNLAKKISEVDFVEVQNFKTGFEGFDHALGGGIIEGSLTLLGGRPGVGKSTLLMQVCKTIINTKSFDVLYISGEESLGQVAMRAKRLNAINDKLYVLSETCWEDMIQEIKRVKPKFIVLDSIQTTYTNEISAPAGTLTQVRGVTFELLRVIKQVNIPCIVIGHINKDGNLAGPKVLEHMVDTVLYFDKDLDGPHLNLKVQKNRFGSTSNKSKFFMGQDGLEHLNTPS